MGGESNLQPSGRKAVLINWLPPKFETQLALKKHYVESNTIYSRSYKLPTEHLIKQTQPFEMPNIDPKRHQSSTSCNRYILNITNESSRFLLPTAFSGHAPLHGHWVTRVTPHYSRYATIHTPTRDFTSPELFGCLRDKGVAISHKFLQSIGEWVIRMLRWHSLGDHLSNPGCPHTFSTGGSFIWCPVLHPFANDQNYLLQATWKVLLLIGNQPPVLLYRLGKRFLAP